MWTFRTFRMDAKTVSPHMAGHRQVISRISKGSKNILIYNFIITTFDCKGGSQGGGTCISANALARPGVVPPLCKKSLWGANGNPAQHSIHSGTMPQKTTDRAPQTSTASCAKFLTFAVRTTLLSRSATCWTLPNEVNTSASAASNRDFFC